MQFISQNYSSLWSWLYWAWLSTYHWAMYMGKNASSVKKVDQYQEYNCTRGSPQDHLCRSNSFMTIAQTNQPQDKFLATFLGSDFASVLESSLTQQKEINTVNIVSLLIYQKTKFISSPPLWTQPKRTDSKKSWKTYLSWPHIGFDSIKKWRNCPRLIWAARTQSMLFFLWPPLDSPTRTNSTKCFAWNAYLTRRRRRHISNKP